MKAITRFIFTIVYTFIVGLWELVGWLSPRLWRATRPLRTRLSKALQWLWARWLKKPVMVTVTLGLGGLIFINGMVRQQGGGAGWLDTKHIGNKAMAISKLLLHLPLHSFGACTRSPYPYIRRAAEHHQIPPALVEAIAYTESRFKPHAISEAGAMGMMQLMPGTARYLGVWDPFDARENIYGGAKYLAELWARYNGDVRRVAAAYHAGPNAVAVYGPVMVGPKTRRYMKIIFLRYKRANTSKSN